MSCIYRDPQGRIVLMCKGADAIVKDRLSQDSLNGTVYRNTQEYVDEFA
jgi:magnesium-transporting ATPase (P-type)